MNKIPTLFKRDPDNMAHVLPEVHPDCRWVLDGEGMATRKYDGTCIMYDGSRWWARREVKPGKAAPEGYVPLSTDDNTGKTVGWEPIEQSAFLKYVLEAHRGDPDGDYPPGTYELCGPKVNGNPEQFNHHTLIRHEMAEYLSDVPLTFQGLKTWLAITPFEGIVWHHPDGRMAKLKRRDFSAPASPSTSEGLK